MAQESLPHIFLTDSGQEIAYTAPSSRGRTNIPPRNRQQHSQRLIRKFDEEWNRARLEKQSRTAVSLPTKNGLYLEFKSHADADLITKSLENIRSGIRLLNVKGSDESGGKVVTATVYVPAGKENYFLNKIQQYATDDTASGKPKNAKLVNSIEDIQLAVLESFWQDPIEYMPGTTEMWCEVWLRTGKNPEDSDISINSFISSCQELEIQYQEQESYLSFPERSVILVKATNVTLASLLEANDYVAEFRIAKETARFWAELQPIEQAQWVEDLRNRLIVNTDANVSIGILDTGVNNGHELLIQILADEDRHTFNPAWGIEDHHGHGTQMAGIAAFGDLQEHLEHDNSVEINHKIGSVKILPPQGNNKVHQWGAITQQAISRLEIQDPDSIHIGCMAVTSSLETDLGRPSSWSAAIDAMTSGYLGDKKRLFIVSAGNIRDENDFRNYPEFNLIRSVENPGQSWNALTVGAYTQKTQITDPTCSDHHAIAPVNGLSPYSTTSLIWDGDGKKWPYKPDVVFEGGNRGCSPDQQTSNYEDLSLLTTHHLPAQHQFEITDGTSPATAQASWMAAQIQTTYPSAWPETIRGLMVHSAQWPEQILQQFNIDRSRKTEMAKLLRICGYGVPDLSKAIRCANNSLTLIAQEYLQPYDKKASGGYCTKDMHVHELPWPKEELLNLRETPITLRVTLSYFIEPGPGEVGWKDRYRYPSHALRFDLNSTGENRDEFLQRLNVAAREEEYDSDLAPDSGSDRWLIGKQNRKFGSIHSDIWEGTAADIASCNLLGVFPVIGWWRERHHLNKWNEQARYSLIISLNTPEQEVDLYTPVAVKLKIPIQT